ncbi:Precorrin-3B methylase [Nostoc sp.]|uniref:Precorrin-3B methylase n=1 Tax=Nostoc sp. TaxID=1180 RepID=UPI002FFC377E
MTKQDIPLTGDAPIKEVCRRIRVARSYWDAHNNAACRGERDRALALYNTLTKEQKDQIPQVLRVWLRYRSEKYFGAHRTPPKSARKYKIYSKVLSAVSGAFSRC